MTKRLNVKRGRPALPPGERRIQIAARVTPETAAWLAAEKAASGRSLGAILDHAVLDHRVSLGIVRASDQAE